MIRPQRHADEPDRQWYCGKCNGPVHAQISMVFGDREEQIPGVAASRPRARLERIWGEIICGNYCCEWGPPSYLQDGHEVLYEIQGALLEAGSEWQCIGVGADE